MATVIVTVGLALIGYLATYLNGLRLAQRQARLTRVNQQLSDFYGPLFALMEANSRTYDTWSVKYARPDGSDPFRHETPPTEQELAEWRIWATTVFIPNIKAMRDVVVTKADLLIEEEMPDALLQLCAHVSGYEITAARWAQGNYEEHLSVITFPGRALREYIRDRFTQLKREQARLLGHDRAAGGSR
ncbi:hypothetical protein [Streptomyces diastatochromogenes]|uniref:DUF4760 domain-containing protein n=1 Tax=Streptomyces diastatochromogenes TaxID=42236 RepID=A0A233S8L3_STRDA|nr:hypothetical protein [Streptomyces diastatochromogenes]MCZ0990495.1 hypothetical protein [Streptomyces diastatochromogenes]OXY91971.1 hypothetical protein BEK98_28235 [Streptomyces diastatochromogenes]